MHTMVKLDCVHIQLQVNVIQSFIYAKYKLLVLHLFAIEHNLTQPWMPIICENNNKTFYIFLNVF